MASTAPVGSCAISQPVMPKIAIAAGADQIVECGPGKVLTGLNRRIEKNAADYAAIFDGGSLAATLETCKGASDA